MGNIVFKTIAENIKSFFGKEEELFQDPKTVPDPASDVFEHPSPENKQTTSKIIEKSLPTNARPKLPFTPDQLRSALQEPVKKKPEIEEAIHHEISAFENALDAVEEPTPIHITPPIEIPTHLTTDMPKGFFDEFSQFALKEDLDTGGMLEGNVLDKMKEFHRHMKETNEYVVYTNEVKSNINRKLSELQTLEREWFHTQEQLDQLQKGLHDIEQSIDERSQELKKYIGEAKTRTRLEKTAKPGEEFILHDGRKLTSLLDLRVALATMPDDIFRHHVSGKQNDFATWITSALDEKELGAGIRGVTTKYHLQSLLEQLA